MRTVWLSILSFLESYLKLEEIINTVFILTPVFTYEIRDHSNKRVLDRKLKWKFKKIIKEKLQSNSFENIL